ncbi:hypothetical protein BV898_06290 [Hypsibius exemplaris]|uniref:Uncharacterized protein n=1 Tax=Hypsibius exemplaris TaxID=2072580 RepID=A0A1W0WX30_HYPEX|nr:hypothetical protein BV898_06290 [Hypsibius exemplaris]
MDRLKFCLKQTFSAKRAIITILRICGLLPPSTASSLRSILHTVPVAAACVLALLANLNIYYYDYLTKSATKGLFDVVFYSQYWMKICVTMTVLAAFWHKSGDLLKIMGESALDVKKDYTAEDRPCNKG